MRERTSAVAMAAILVLAGGACAAETSADGSNELVGLSPSAAVTSTTNPTWSSTPPEAPVALPTTSSSTTSTPATSTSTTTTSTTSTPTSTSTTTSSTTTSSTTTTTTTSLPPVVMADPWFTATGAAFDRLAGSNAAASMTVVQGGVPVWSRASGTTIDGHAATSDSPMVVASVSKIVVAIGIARLAANGLVDIDGPVPWGDIGIMPHPTWLDVTIRELLDHTSGVPKARYSWFTGEGTCETYVPSLVAGPPLAHRGTWVYSNGNYCLLGMVVGQRTGLPLDQALQQLVFDPVGADGVHQTLGGLLPGDLPHGLGVGRLSRLGGAGTLVVSTDDVALAVAGLTPADRAVLRPPGVFVDQYGYGHTGTVDGAKSCVWVVDGGSTVIAATIAGDAPSTGGGLCDIIVSAITIDLGISVGPPVRTP